MKQNGTITALITPFINQEIDEESFRINIHRQLAAGIDGILALGSTGEASTLSPEEQTRIIQMTVKEAKGKVPVWVGTGSYCTRQTIEKTKKAKDMGADVALIVTPYYNKPTQEGIFRHFEAISAKTDIPIVVYNIPGRCSTNIENSTMLNIAALPNVIGVKESSGNMAQAGAFIQKITKKYPDFQVFSGDDISALPMIALGAVGLVSVVSNLIPREIISLTRACLSNNFIAARQIHYQLLPLFNACFLETNPIPIKMAMQLCDHIQSGECRLPLTRLTSENFNALSQVLDEMHLSSFAVGKHQFIY